MSLFQNRLPEVHRMLTAKEVSVSELTEESLAIIAERDKNVNAFLTLNEEGARSTARALDDKLASEQHVGCCLVFLLESRIIL